MNWIKKLLGRDAEAETPRRELRRSWTAELEIVLVSGETKSFSIQGSEPSEEEAQSEWAALLEWFANEDTPTFTFKFLNGSMVLRRKAVAAIKSRATQHYTWAR